MNVAEMKVAGKAKGSANVDVSTTKGEALAGLMVKWAWDRAAEEEKAGQKLRMFVANIMDLDEKGHVAFRAQLKAEVDSIAELEKVSGIADSRKAGYSLNSFRVRVSQWRAISEAAQIGAKFKTEEGEIVAYTQALDIAKEARAAHVSNGGAQVKAGGRAMGGGRKELTDYDKAIRAVSKLNLRDIRKLKGYCEAFIEAAETKSGKRSTATA